MEDDMSVKDYADLARSGKKFPVEMEMMKTTIESNRETIKLAKETTKYLRRNFLLTFALTVVSLTALILSIVL